MLCAVAERDRWDADHGLFLNNEHVKLRGFCDHTNFGGVGKFAALTDSVKRSIVCIFIEIGNVVLCSLYCVCYRRRQSGCHHVLCFVFVAVYVCMYR